MWVHFDEKWFWGMVARYAKRCEALGLMKEELWAYHRGYINKVMVVAVVAFAFDGNVENGGTAVKIGLWRVEAPRIALKAG